MKLTYEEKLASVVFQVDVTEKGVGLKDAYFAVKEPWAKAFTLKGGVFYRPFGYEIGNSSSRRDSPERSTVFLTLFPDERDLGASIVVQPEKSSPLHFLKLEAGLIAGNGIKQETDRRKDFIGHLSMAKGLNSSIRGSMGVSYYNGGVYQGTENVYTVQDGKFVLNSDASNKGKFAKREYYGVDVQVNVASILGNTQISAEYLTGTQPGSIADSRSPNSSSLPATDTYIRNFAGAYVMLVQYISQTPIAAMVKYDFYDPDTKLKGDKIETVGDVKFHTTGLGALWNLTDNFRLTAYYEIVRNEKSANPAGYSADIKDDAFTLRLQYKF
jgi:hypothetical protein